jgi:hypothetical protein
MNFFFTGKEQIKRETDQRNMTFHHAMQRMKLGEQPTPGRRDFMSFLMRRNRDGGGLTDPEILVDCPVLIGASSETTTTALSGFFFYLGTSPQAYRRLVEEVRASFKSESEINMKTTKQLEYLNATVDEALRVYPPAAESPPRISPGAEIEGKYLPKGVRPSTYPNHDILTDNRRSSYPSTSGAHSTTLITSLTQMITSPSDGSSRLTRYTIPSTPMTTAQCSDRLGSA